jgi:hypothetical protein
MSPENEARHATTFTRFVGETQERLAIIKALLSGNAKVVGHAMAWHIRASARY